MKNRKYIFSLALVLIIFYIAHNVFLLEVYEFSRIEEYVFNDKKPSVILKDCEKLYNNLDEESEILNIVKLIQLSDYLLYEDSIDSGTYYDLIMTIMATDKKENVGYKENYGEEIDVYLNRKRKAGIRYIKYEASKPVFYSQGDMKYGYVVTKTCWSSGIYYLKYSFIYEDGFWNLQEVKDIDSVKEKG